MAEPCTSFDCTSLTFIYDLQQDLHASCTSNWNLPRFWPRPSGAARRAGRHHERHVGVAQQRTMRACVSSGMQEGAALLHPSLHKAQRRARHESCCKGWQSSTQRERAHRAACRRALPSCALLNGGLRRPQRRELPLRSCHKDIGLWGSREDIGVPRRLSRGEPIVR